MQSSTLYCTSCPTSHSMRCTIGGRLPAAFQMESDTAAACKGLSQDSACTWGEDVSPQLTFSGRCQGCWGVEELSTKTMCSRQTSRLSAHGHWPPLRVNGSVRMKTFLPPNSFHCRINASKRRWERFQGFSLYLSRLSRVGSICSGRRNSCQL